MYQNHNNLSIANKRNKIEGGEDINLRFVQT